MRNTIIKSLYKPITYYTNDAKVISGNKRFIPALQKIILSLKYKLSALVIVICAIILLYSAFLYFFSIPSVSKAWAILTTIKPDSFTELYFEDHLTLPKTVENNKIYTFKFTTHNLEYKDMTYPYEVYILDNGKKQTIEKKTFMLKQDQYKTLQEKFTFTKPLKDRAEIIVYLINNDQQIDFWIEGKQIQPSSTIKMSKKLELHLPTPQPKKFGGWYWQPKLNRSQVWLGTDTGGNDIWSDYVPI